MRKKNLRGGEIDVEKVFLTSVIDVEYEIPKGWHKTSDGFEKDDGMGGVFLSDDLQINRAMVEMMGFRKRK